MSAAGKIARTCKKLKEAMENPIDDLAAALSHYLSEHVPSDGLIQLSKLAAQAKRAKPGSNEIATVLDAIESAKDSNRAL